MKLLKKLLPVVLMTLLAWNCEKEDVIPEKIATEKEFSIEEISFEQLSNKELVSEVFQKIKNSPKGSPAEKAKLSNFTIDSSKVKKLIRNGKTTYIFLVKRDSLDLERFENLVVFKDSNNTTKAFLLEYLTEHAELAEPHSSFSYDGKPKITPLSETENIGAAAKQLQICYSVTATYCTWGGTHIAGAACLAANDDRTYTVNQTNCIWFDDGSSSGSPGDSGGGGGGGGPNPEDGFDNSPLGDDLTFKVKNFVKYSLSITERQRFYAASDTFRKQMAVFLDAHNFSGNAKTLAKEMVALNHRLNYSMGHSELSYLIENPYMAEEINNFLDINTSPEAKDYAVETFIDFDNAELEDFEQDYKGRMSVSERTIFDSMTRFKQLGYLLNAQKATWESENLYPNSLYNGKGDAFRHTYFNGLNAILLGATLAEDLATAHEDKPAPPNYPNYFKEVQMDLFNNAVGRNKRNWLSDGYDSLSESIQDATVNGELRYLSNLQGSGTSGRATSQSQLIPTN